MTQVINSNIPSLTAQRSLGTTQGAVATSLERLGSGLRINSAKDDAAGLAISERFTSQIRGLNQAARNANDGISLAQTAEGDLGQIGNSLQRIRELSVQSANATNSASDRAALQAEVDELVAEIDRVAQQSNFNGVSLLDGSFSSQKFQVGANAGQTITVDSISSARTSALGQFQGFAATNLSIGTADNTAAATTVAIGGGSAIDLGTIAQDAKALASALNAAGAGFVASADETQVAAAATDLTAAVAGNDTVTINGVGITVANTGAAGSAQTNRTNAVDAINAQSSVTGVVATDTGSGVSLAAADGRNVTVAFTGSNAANGLDNFGLAAAATTGATIDITFTAESGVTGNVVFTGSADELGTGGTDTVAIGSTGTAIAAVDISTVGGAETAINAVDAALSQINGSRADLGAIQNRFESVVGSLQTSSENLSAARSRIRDADFAAETAELARSQVLQQAGISVLAQANAQPQNVLALLQ